MHLECICFSFSSSTDRQTYGRTDSVSHHKRSGRIRFVLRGPAFRHFTSPWQCLCIQMVRDTAFHSFASTSSFPSFPLSFSFLSFPPFPFLPCHFPPLTYFLFLALPFSFSLFLSALRFLCLLLFPSFLHPLPLVIIFSLLLFRFSFCLSFFHYPLIFFYSCTEVRLHIFWVVTVPNYV